MTAERSYEDGLRDGKIESLEKLGLNHTERLNSHSKRISVLKNAAILVLGSFTGTAAVVAKLLGLI